MAFIPDNAFRQRFKDKISPILWEFYQYLCMKRNHETRLSNGTVEHFIVEYGYQRASKFNLLKELRTTRWIAGNDGAYSLTVGDFSAVDKKADDRRSKREMESKKIDFAEKESKKIDSESKNLDEKSKKIDSESKKIDSHIRNIPASSSSISQDSYESFERESAPAREVPVETIFEIHEPRLDEISTRAIEIYREVFPTCQVSGQTLTDFAARLPEVEESVWRQTLLDWRLARYKATNIPGMISRYEKDLKEKQNAESKPINPHGHQRKRTNAEVFSESADFYHEWQQTGNIPA